MSDNTMPRNAGDIDALAGEYVLGTLDIETRRDIEQRLPEEGALRAAVERWEKRLQPYTRLAEPIEPPAALWGRIEHTLAHASQDAVVRDTLSPPTGPTWLQALWQNLSLWRGLAVCGLAGMLTLGTLTALKPAQPAAPRFLVVLMTPQHSQAGWVVQASSPRDIELIPTGGFEVPPGKTLEFWTKADDWGGPVSLGLIEPGESRHLSLEHLPPLEENQLFELTLEDAGGSPLDHPTGPIQFIGRAVAL
ncbi:anti-sigma factor [Salinicola avicenniae]|uniref:anti-sigma factor n=1 Tax=Salinicola avicenniae TaxID=2916836 RepID=UPI00207369C4|nr:MULTISPECIES: anti-sigma factor [unclassified Salinicola]